MQSLPSVPKWLLDQVLNNTTQRTTPCIPQDSSPGHDLGLLDPFEEGTDFVCIVSTCLAVLPQIVAFAVQDQGRHIDNGIVQVRS